MFTSSSFKVYKNRSIYLSIHVLIHTFNGQVPSYTYTFTQRTRKDCIYKVTKDNTPNSDLQTWGHTTETRERVYIKRVICTYIRRNIEILTV